MIGYSGGPDVGVPYQHELVGGAKSLLLQLAGHVETVTAGEAAGRWVIAAAFGGAATKITTPAAAG